MDDKLKVGGLLYRDKGLVSHAEVYLGGSHVLHIQPMRIGVVSALALEFLTFSDKNGHWLGTAVIGRVLGLALHTALRNYVFVI